jgi:hypothetical protein
MPNSTGAETSQRSPFKGFMPFLWLALACLGGIVLADWMPIPGWVWGVGFALCVGALLLAWRLPPSLVLTHHLRNWTRFHHRLPGALLAAAFCLGAWRYAATRPVVTPERAVYYNDRGTVQLVGTVVKAPDVRDNFTNLEVQVEQLQLLSEGRDNPSALKLSRARSWSRYTRGVTGLTVTVCG